MVRANTDGNMCRGDAAIILRLAIDAEWVEDHSIRQWVVHGRRNGPVGVEDEVDWHTTMAVDKSRKEGTEVVPTRVLDPPQAGRSQVGTRMLASQGLKDKWESKTGYIWIYIV